MDGTTATTSGMPTKLLTMAEIDAAINKLRGIPPSKWMLVSPSGVIWTDENPMKLAHILAGVALGIGPVVIGPAAPTGQAQGGGT